MQFKTDEKKAYPEIDKPEKQETTAVKSELDPIHLRLNCEILY